MKKIEGEALDLVSRVLGLAGSRPGAQTLLDDGNVSQVLELFQLVRRSRTPGFTGGSFHGVLENVHGAANNVTSIINPYAPGAAARSPWPTAVPAGYDVWVLTSALGRSAGAGDLSGGLLVMAPATAQLGWGVNQAGDPVTVADNMPLTLWTGLNATAAGNAAVGVTGDGSVRVALLQRIRRGTSLRLHTTSDAAATFRCYMKIGLFPEALGQDVAQ